MQSLKKISNGSSHGLFLTPTNPSLCLMSTTSALSHFHFHSWIVSATIASRKRLGFCLQGGPAISSGGEGCLSQGNRWCVRTARRARTGTRESAPLSLFGYKPRGVCHVWACRDIRNKFSPFPAASFHCNRPAKSRFYHCIYPAELTKAPRPRRNEDIYIHACVCALQPSPHCFRSSPMWMECRVKYWWYLLGLILQGGFCIGTFPSSKSAMDTRQVTKTLLVNQIYKILQSLLIAAAAPFLNALSLHMNSTGFIKKAKREMSKDIQSGYLVSSNDVVARVFPPTDAFKKDISIQLYN